MASRHIICPMSDKTSTSWPVVPGSYLVGDVNGPVAVCTLTSERLMGPLAGLPGVAIAGMVYTANLGITRIVVNITTNPAIRFLLICGKDSPLFRPGQSLVALADHGVDSSQRIVRAAGYEPVLQSLTHDQIGHFRRQVEVVDWTGEEDLESIKRRVNELSARNPGRFMTGTGPASPSTSLERFATIRPGGQREPLLYDPKGYFVITVDNSEKEIILRHYLPDHTPAHEMRGRGTTSMMLGLVREGLVTQLSHAGYLGEELAKAQTALQFGLRYDQDRPLRSQEASLEKGVETASSQSSQTENSESTSVQQTPRSKGRVQPLTLKQFEDTALGEGVDCYATVTDLPREQILGGVLLESSEAEPFDAFHRTSYRTEILWSPATRIIMGQPSELTVGALLRVVGKRTENHGINADQIVILTRVARIIS